MKRSKYGSIAIAALIFVSAVLLAGQSMALPFKLTIENLTQNVLTPALFITHNSDVDIFTEGDPASPAVELVAEGGVNSGVEAIANAAKGVSVLDVQTAAANGGPILPGQSATTKIEATKDFNLLSYMSMFAISNDGFIGGTTGDGAIDLFPGGIPAAGTYYIAPADVWDGGTEINDELAANVPALGGFGSVDQNGVLSRNHPGILGIGDINPNVNWTNLDFVASITIDPVPEPSTMLLFGAGLIGLIGFVRKKRG